MSAKLSVIAARQKTQQPLEARISTFVNVFGHLVIHKRKILVADEAARVGDLRHHARAARSVGRAPVPDLIVEKHNTSHTGTHLDAALHCVHDGQTTAQIPLEKCVGPAFVLHLPHRSGKGDHFEKSDFEPHAQAIKKHRKLLIATGWSRNWDTPDYYDNFPGFSREGAQYIVALGLDLIGVEQSSIHPSDHLEVHRIFFRREVVIVEGLKNVAELPQGEVDFTAAPWRFEGGDGSPVRAFARI